MLVSLNWPLLEIRRTRSRLIMFYKSVHGLVAIQLNPNLLVQNSSRTRQVQGTNLCTFRQISTTKDSYKHSFFPRTIIQWNMLPVAAFQAHTVDAFKVIVIVPVIVSATIYWLFSSLYIILIQPSLFNVIYIDIFFLNILIFITNQRLLIIFNIEGM